MCGLYAVLDPRGVDVETLHTAAGFLHHRGPDQRGVWRGGPVGLAHTRLALQGGPQARQPVQRGDRVGITNGELYNHAELGDGADSAVLVGLLRDGPEALHRARGAFAAITWDGDTLLAVRDRFGIKPLYWSWDDGRLVLASEPHLAVQGPARWDAGAVAAMFTHQYLLPDQTVFAGVHALEPGTFLRARPGEPPTLGRWWSWVPERPPEPVDVEGVLTAAVHARATADQPVAVQLSGGIDSALVAAMAADVGVETAYTFRFVGPSDWDEADRASEIAQHLGLRHVVVEADAAALLDDLDAAVVASGGPVINTHAAAKWQLVRRVWQDGHAVLLTGEGADELFWGYAHLLAEARACRDASPATPGVHLPHGDSLRTAAISAPWGSVPTFLRAKASLGHRLRRVSSGLPAPSFAPLLAALGVPPQGHPASRAAWAWARLCLAGSILQRLTDPLEGAWGVEGRLPFLDVTVAEAAARLPPAARVGPDGLGKAPLRAIAARRLPAGVATRVKHPFMGPPLPRELLRPRLLDGPVLPFVDRAAVEQALAADTHAVAWDPVWVLLLSCQALAEAHGL
jgi:asparagine synthase (glutamine-hydrolysing)